MLINFRCTSIWIKFVVYKYLLCLVILWLDFAQGKDWKNTCQLYQHQCHNHWLILNQIVQELSNFLNWEQWRWIDKWNKHTSTPLNNSSSHHKKYSVQTSGTKDKFANVIPNPFLCIGSRVYFQKRRWIKSAFHCKCRPWRSENH